jgi:two-component system cell cycle sensor histidine kinase/response regulator CckA
MMEGYYEVDLKGNYTYFNQVVADFHKRSHSEFMGMNCRDHFSPEEAKRVIQIFNNVYKTGIPAQIDACRIIKKDGSVGIIEMTVAVLRDDSGEPAGFHGATRDVTEKIQFEKKLRKSEDKYRNILKNMEEGYYETDLAGNFTFVNAAICKIIGYPADELMGMNYRKYSSPEEAKRITHIFKNVYKTGIPVKIVDCEVIRKNRSISMAETSVSLIKNTSGKPVGFFGISRDVTETKSLKAQLIHAQKMEAVGILAGGISHDFNNLLQAILGYCQIIQLDKPSDYPDLNKLRAIEKSAQRAAELTAQLLAFSRKEDIHPRPLNLNYEVKQIEKLLERTIPKMISIELQLEENLKPVNADSGQLEQVILNIGVNARDAMPEGGGLTIKTENVQLTSTFCQRHLGATPGEHVLLSIADTGQGMDEDVREHIFEPFYTTKETGKGTGLGLAMVYGIIKNHNGYICCESNPDLGTTFNIYLPVIKADVETPEDDQQMLVSKGTGETILVIDDEEILRDLLENMLLRSGYSVIKARNGREGLKLYQKKIAEVDLVILDLILPGMGGKQVLAEILKLNPKAKVLVASGYFLDHNTKDDTIVGAKGFIKKPYDIKKMLDVIQKLVDKPLS